MLKGYKSYLLGFLMIVLAGCYHLGYIDGALFTSLATLLTGGSVMALRAGMKKAE